jgi:histone acetyltransferase MYST1
MSLITSIRPSAAGEDGRRAKGGSGVGRAEEDAAMKGLPEGTFRPGTRIFAKFRDGTDRQADVIDAKFIKGEDGVGRVKYYVHYRELNRRMDTWLDAEHVKYDAEGDAQARDDRAKAERAKAMVANSSVGSGGKSGKSFGKGGHGGSSSGHVISSGHGGGRDGTEIVDSDGTILRIHKRKVRPTSFYIYFSSSSSRISAQADGEMVVDFVEPDHEADGMTEEAIRDHEEVTKVKNVNYIEIGKYRMETWYFSPLPKEYWVEGIIDTVSTTFLPWCPWHRL